MPEGGLFSGMKFTDIFFPAAAAAASMYNPHVGRGIQTGLNTFNSFAAFQDSARYYKRLKEEQERADVGAQNLHAGIGGQLGFLGEQRNKFFERPAGEFGPLVDESQTSRFGMFGEEGPELPDPEQEATLRQELEARMEAAPSQFDLGVGDAPPDQFGLGMEEISNPRFSEIVTGELADQVELRDLSEDEMAMLNATDFQIAQQELAKSAIEASPGSAANQALMAGYRGMDTEYRDADRIKDMQTVIKQREDADIRQVLQRELRVDEEQKLANIWAENKRLEQAGSQKLIDQQMSGRDEEGNLTASTIRQYTRYMSQAVDSYAAPTSDVKAKAKFKEEAISYAIMLRHAGVQLPAYMEEWIREHDKEQTAASQVEAVKGANESQAKVVKDINPTNVNAWLAQFQEGP